MREAGLLSEALDVPVDVLAPISREPLGSGTVAGFELPDGALAYVDTSLLAVAHETGLALDGVARVWMHPSDPHLPALAAAAFGDAAEVLLRRLGLTADGMPVFVGYRPGRRAVLRVPLTDGTSAWVKVVRPRRVERIAHVHAALRRAGLPVPDVRGWSPDGLLVLEAATGSPATQAEWNVDELVDAVDDLRARLRTVPLDGVARTSLAARLPWYAEGLTRALPSHAELVAATASRCAPTLALEPATSETIHGDLHLGQLFLRGGQVSGLIDVDTAGRGFAGDDASAFVGHAVASALLTTDDGGDATRVWELADRARERWAADPRTGALVAVHLFGHALGAATAGATARATTLLEIADATVRHPKRPLTPAFEAP